MRGVSEMRKTNPVWIGGASGNQSVTVTASATANALGAWSLFGSVPYPIDRITIVVDATTSDAAYNILMNIGIGASGSQVVLVPNIPMLNSVNNFTAWTLTLDIPILPPNTDIWGQIQSNLASEAPRISMAVQYVGHQKKTPTTALGITLSTSGGTAYTTGSGAYGSWVSVGSTLIPYDRMMVISTRPGGTFSTINIGIGASGSQQIIQQDMPVIFEQPMIEIEGFFPPGNYWIAGYSNSVNTIEAAILMN